MVFGSNIIERIILLQGNEMENAEIFTYFGRTVTYDLDCKKDCSSKFNGT